MAGNLFAGLGDFGRNLFESTIFSAPFDMQRNREAEAAIRRRRQETAGLIGQIGQQGPQSSDPMLGGASMFDQSGGVLPDDQQPGMMAPPQAQTDPMQAAQRALAQGAVLRNGDYGKAWDIIKPADPYTLTSADTRYDGNNQEVARGRPQPYTLSGPEGSGQIRYSGENQPLASFTTPGVSLPGGPAPMGPPGATGGPPPPTQSGSLDPIAFFKQFVGPHEGGLNPHDANGSPTNFGINQAANPSVDVHKLTPDTAAQIFAQKYFAGSGADKLPPALAAVHADTAFINPTRAQQFLQQSGGDPQKYMDLRDGWMTNLVESEPGKYGPYAKAWANRNRDLRAYAERVGGGDQPQGAGMPPPAAVSGRGPGFVTAPQKQPAAGHPSTPQEIAAAGLPPGTRSWTDPTGKPTPFGDAFQPPPTGSDLTGEDFLKTLPAGYAAQIKAYANGDISLPGGNRAGSRQQQKLLNDIFQYDPSASAANLTSRSATRRDLAVGKMGQNITALNTAIGHLGTLESAIDKLGNTGLPLNNWAAHGIAALTGTDARITNFQTARKAVADEVTRVFRGTGGSEADIQSTMKLLDDAKSPEALHQASKTIAELLDSRLQSIGEQYNRGMGRTVDPISLLAPHAQQVLTRIHGGGSAPAAGGPARIRVYNPKTGRLE